MGNSFFSFKQFTVRQDKAAMKVCTDACLFGAWVSEQLSSKCADSKQILDIGAGTGLLSLMLAQHTAASIDAIEIDEGAALQARENFEQAPWSERLNIVHGDLRTVSFTNKYDVIISNPPFYSNDLKSPDQQRNLAHHGDALIFDDLLDAVVRALQPMGQFYVLLPYHRTVEFTNVAKSKGLFVVAQVKVRQTNTHEYFRSILCLASEITDTSTEEIIIKTSGEYTDRFKNLLQPYYLYL